MASTVWRGYMSFGLISIPVRLFRAARAERVSLRRLYRSESRAAAPARFPDSEEEEEEEPPERPVRGKARETIAPAPPKEAVLHPAPQPILEPVRQASIRRTADEVLPERSIVKGYEFEKNRFVALEPDELKSLAPQTATQMEIQEFVSLADVDPIYFETSYYVVPEEAGQKAYGLLYRALQTTNLVAVAQFAMHGREHVVVVRPGKYGLIAHTMFFSSEVRADEEYRADASNVTAKELHLAETLIQSLKGPFEPEKYRDTYREKLEELIAKKVAGQPVTPAAPAPRSAAVVDITEALQRSLAALKKPAASEERTPAHATKPKSRKAAAGH